MEQLHHFQGAEPQANYPFIVRELAPDFSSPRLRAPPFPTVGKISEYEPSTCFGADEELSHAEPPTPHSGKGSEPFQLALDLQWAREHHAFETEGRIPPADAQEVRQILIAAVDVIAGRRPPAQLCPQLRPRVFAALQTRARQAIAAPQAMHLRSIHLCQPAKGVIEACATIDHGRAAQALVARLETVQRRWQCTFLRLL